MCNKIEKKKYNYNTQVGILKMERSPWTQMSDLIKTTIIINLFSSSKVPGDFFQKLIDSFHAVIANRVVWVRVSSLFLYYSDNG